MTWGLEKRSRRQHTTTREIKRKRSKRNKIEKFSCRQYRETRPAWGEWKSCQWHFFYPSDKSTSQAPRSTCLGKWAVYVSNYTAKLAPPLLSTKTPAASQSIPRELVVKLNIHFDQVTGLATIGKAGKPIAKRSNQTNVNQYQLMYNES